MKRWLAIPPILALMGVGGFLASTALTAPGDVHCSSTTATASVPSHVVGVDGSPVWTVPGDTATAVATACITEPTSTAGTTTPPPAVSLQYSPNTNRSGTLPLQGANFSVPVCVFLDSSNPAFAPVTFNLDSGAYTRTENLAPFDFVDGSTAAVCIRYTFANGSHSIRTTYAGGSLTSTFTVGTAPPPPPPPPPGSGQANIFVAP